uniref:Uncharacterized protein n=1 Tax=Leersia perrieri TaxID=77586 RepID=A0A0D9WHU7_9ORYZ
MKEAGRTAQLGNGGLIRVLFETPSGFAIFVYDGVNLIRQDAMQAVVLIGFEKFENKLAAINHDTGVSERLAMMINKYMAPGQKLAVETDGYKKIIKKSLGISCLCGRTVDELMWGLKIHMGFLVPEENSEQTNEDRFPKSVGMRLLLNRHSFRVQPDMMVTKQIIQKTGLVHECDQIVNKHSDSLRTAAEHLKEISCIDTQDWDLMKLAAALKMICCPEEKIEAGRWLFLKQQLKRFRDDAPKYKDKILKMPCLVVYDEMY